MHPLRGKLMSSTRHLQLSSSFSWSMKIVFGSHPKWRKEVAENPARQIGGELFSNEKLISKQFRPSDEWNQSQTMMTWNVMKFTLEWCWLTSTIRQSFAVAISNTKKNLKRTIKSSIKKKKAMEKNPKKIAFISHHRNCGVKKWQISWGFDVIGLSWGKMWLTPKPAPAFYLIIMFITLTHFFGEVKFVKKPPMRKKKILPAMYSKRDDGVECD